MALLAAEANKLTNPSLQRGLVQTVIERGARELAAQLPFKSFVGESYSFVIEDSIATGNSAQDPYGTTIPSGGGSNKRITVPATVLHRNAKTAKIDIIGKSDYFDQRANDFEKEAKKLAQDFVYQFLNGRVDKTGTHTGYNIRGIEDWLNEYSAYVEQRVFGTDTGAIDGTPASLSLTMIDDLLSRQKGDRFQVLYMSRETSVAFKALLNSMGGNTAQMLMNDTFGMPMLHYDGVPIVVHDAVGPEKAFDEATVDTDTVTVTDSEFLGFSDLDLGVEITVGTGSATITAITDTHTVTVDDGSSLDTGEGGSVARKPVIYALRFDMADGICAIYHQNRGVPANAGEHYGPIAGFDAEDLGLQPNAPQYWTRLDWYGNVVVQSPYAVARLSHFDV